MLLSPYGSSIIMLKKWKKGLKKGLKGFEIGFKGQ